MGLVWIGHTKGVEGLFNVPARDLTAAEVKIFGGEKALLATGLYAKAEAPSGNVSSSKANKGDPKPFTYPMDETPAPEETASDDE